MIRSLCALCFILNFTAAQARPHSFEKGGGLHFIKELELNPEQTRKVKEIKEKYESQKRQSHDEIKDLKQDLKASLEAPQRGEDYKKLLLEKFAKLQEKKRAQHFKRFEMALEIREILTDEQIKKFQALQHHKDPQE